MAARPSASRCTPAPRVTPVPMPHGPVTGAGAWGLRESYATRRLTAAGAPSPPPPQQMGGCSDAGVRVAVWPVKWGPKRSAHVFSCCRDLQQKASPLRPAAGGGVATWGRWA